MSKTTTPETELVQAALSELDEDDRYRLLADDRRRTVIEILADQHIPLTLTELATAVEAREDTDQSPTEIRIALHHKHLPMMDEGGLVHYNAETHKVTPLESDPDLLGA